MMEQYMWIIWISIFVISIIIEIATTELVSIFFCFGSLISMIISFIPGVTWWIELIIFVVMSGFTLLGLRPLIKKKFSKEKRNTNVDELIGRKCKIISKTEDGYPQVKINGLIWRVVSINEEEMIDIGEIVEIVSISGNKFIVKKLKGEK